MKKKATQKRKAKPVDPARQLARCLKVLRSAVPPEQRSRITVGNIDERIADLVKIAEQFQAARQATAALKALGLS